MRHDCTLRFSSNYRQQLRSVIDYYELNAGPAITDRLVDAVENALEHITAFPDAAPYYVPPADYDALRALRIRQFNLMSAFSFPYTIFYAAEKQSIVIHAIYHQSRSLNTLADTLDLATKQ